MRPHGRQSFRLRSYDYRTPGAYAVTIVIQDRRPLLGRVDTGRVRLTPAGRMIRDAWAALPRRFPSVETDAFVVMPDHFHGIVFIDAPDKDASTAGAALAAAPAGGIATDMDAAATTAGVDAAGRDIVAVVAATRAAPTMNHGWMGDLAAGRPALRSDPTLGHVVGAFKSLTTVVYMRGVRDRRWPTFRRRLWQRGYHDRVIRDEEHLRRVRDYIANNPVRWRASP